MGILRLVMICGRAVTTTVWSSAVKKTLIHAIVRAASATFLLPAFPCPGVVSCLKDPVTCFGEKACFPVWFSGGDCVGVSCAAGLSGVPASEFWAGNSFLFKREDVS